MKMVIVSSREFRANQRKYFDLARTNDVVITSRMHGSYRLVPISEDDTLISESVLEDKIKRGIEELQQHTRTGTGQVEPLNGYDGNVYSRRITSEHRLVYRVLDDVVEVLVLSAFGHYK